MKKNLILYPIFFFLISYCAYSSLLLDCQFAQSKRDKIICQDSELSRLNTKLNRAYEKAKRKIIHIKEIQFEWEKKNKNETRPKVLKELYLKQIALLEGFEKFNIGGPHWQGLYGDHHQSDKGEQRRIIIDYCGKKYCHFSFVHSGYHYCGGNIALRLLSKNYAIGTAINREGALPAFDNDKTLKNLFFGDSTLISLALLSWRKRA